MSPSDSSTAKNQQGIYPSVSRIVGGTAGLILILVFATLITLLTSYRDTISQQETNLRNLSFAFSKQTLSAVRSIEQAVDEVQREYLRSGGGDKDTNRIAGKHLYFHNPLHPRLLDIYLFSSNKRLLAIASPSGGPLISDADIKAVAPPTLDAKQSMHIDITDVDARTGHGILNFSRPLVDGTGNVLGVILARVDSESFQELYTSVQLGEGGSVTLENLDGTMLVRGPTLPQWIGKSFRATPLFNRYIPVAQRGVFESTSPVDGKDRFYGYDVVNDYPLVIVVGIDKSVAMAFWHRYLWTVTSSLGVVIFLVLFLAWRVASDSKRQLALIRQLEGSERRLAKSANYLNKILNAIGNPISVLDRNRRFVLMNDAFSRLVGMHANELLDNVDGKISKAEDASEWKKIYAQVLQSGESIVAESEIVDGQGRHRTVLISASRLTDANGDPQIVKVLTDITERKEAEVRLAYISEFDLLTGLPNHSQFWRVLQEEVKKAASIGRRLGMLIVSLDRLQEINDLLGHEAGDSAVKAAANVFRSFSPQTICTARIKSNEFAVLISCQGSMHALEDFAERLQTALALPIAVFGREFYLGAVVGAASYPHDALAANELMRLADVAKHRASQDGKEPVHLFSRNAHAVLDEQLALEGQLRRAMERGEFRVVYQPKVEIDSGCIVGFEALLRWTNAALGDVSPARFIPVAESTGLIVNIGAWVLEQACRQACSWHEHYGEPVKVAVNLSLRQFHQRDLIPMIKQCIEMTRTPPGTLELEITESTVMSMSNEVDRLMREIRALGVDLSVDDFGTGYSSLAYLKRFPVQRLKIDRAFIHDLGKDEDSLAIVQSIIMLGHGLKLRVVAEGIETAEQLAFLKELSCDEYQGFLFSRPLESDEVIGLLNRNRRVVMLRPDRPT